jgi:molybdenum cofactor guanylyltransferase
MSVLGCLFAGGSGRRFGGQDKALIELSGIPLWKRTTDRVAPMIDALVVTGRREPDWISEVPGLKFVQDFRIEGNSIGPAGGLLAALEHGVRQNGRDSFVLTIPVDAPFFPTDMLERLSSGRGTRCAAVADSAGRLQPTFGLWSCALAPDVRAFIEQGEFALHAIANHVDAAKVRFEGGDTAFLNINTPEDFQRAEAAAASLGAP